jgi:hypothetical protein
VAEKLHKLAALRLLSNELGRLEAQHQQRIEAGHNSAVVDREIAQLAVTAVVAFCLDRGIQSQPLTRLLGALVAVSAGSKPPAMLIPAPAHHRRPQPPPVEAIKGRLAAIMEFQQRQGLSRKAAAQWVVRNFPTEFRARLGRISARTVDDWVAKWGGKHGTAGSGREGYLHTRAILTTRNPPPSEPQLKRLLARLAKHLPS